MPGTSGSPSARRSTNHTDRRPKIDANVDYEPPQLRIRKDRVECRFQRRQPGLEASLIRVAAKGSDPQIANVIVNMSVLQLVSKRRLMSGAEINLPRLPRTIKPQ
jgi:hypothetical protein